MTDLPGEVEIFVVDNNSSDGSLEYLLPRFPFVRFLINKENTGFAKANNQALKLAKGEFILFLNPDTILPEDAFSSCINFMKSRANAGALGVHMIDGSGQFLKESKRGFPSPWVSFGKVSGLTSLFPRSKTFAGYYLGHLSETENHVVDALSGAFMLIRKEVLDKIGGFDEQFFMYGEDLDLSYRIQKAGYDNYYYAGCTIIHFKGESTRKDAHYVELFHKAMIQFVNKHFQNTSSRLYIKVLESAIQTKARFTKYEQQLENKAQLKKQTLQFTLKGDDTSKQALKAQLTGQVVEQDTEPNSTILCEGSQFSFKKIIATLKTASRGKTSFIYTSGAGSIICSPSKDFQGDIIIL